MEPKYPKTGALRVMSFNVQTALPEDEICKRNRLWAVAQEVREYGPDLLGIQEDNQTWVEYLSDPANLPGYGVIARPIDAWKPERCSVYYNQKTLRLVEGGYAELTHDGSFGATGITWEEIPEDIRTALDLTPERVCPDKGYLIPFADGVGSEKAAVFTNRRMTWGVFETGEGKRFLYVNCHLQHRSQTKPIALHNPAYLKLREMERMKEWDILQRNVKKIQKTQGDIPVVITGDMNDLPDSASYRYFTAQGEFSKGVPYTDCSLAAKERLGEAGTFHSAFRKVPEGGVVSPEEAPAKTSATTLDYCFVTPNRFSVDCFRAGEGRVEVEGGYLYSSDHRPIVIDLLMQ